MSLTDYLSASCRVIIPEKPFLITFAKFLELRIYIPDVNLLFWPFPSAGNANYLRSLALTGSYHFARSIVFNKNRESTHIFRTRVVGKAESRTHLNGYLQSPTASATLRNIFEKAFGRSHEIEFLPWPCIYFLSNLGNFPIRDRADVRPFRDILPY